MYYFDQQSKEYFDFTTYTTKLIYIQRKTSKKHLFIQLLVEDYMVLQSTHPLTYFEHLKIIFVNIVYLYLQPPVGPLLV